MVKNIWLQAMATNPLSLKELNIVSKGFIDRQIISENIQTPKARKMIRA